MLEHSPSLLPRLPPHRPSAATKAAYQDKVAAFCAVILELQRRPAHLSFKPEEMKPMTSARESVVHDNIPVPGPHSINVVTVLRLGRYIELKMCLVLMLENLLLGVQDVRMVVI